MSQKILVIADSNVAALFTESVLAKNFAACDVLLASTAAEGFSRFPLAHPDLILLDDSLPDLEVETVCYRLLRDPFLAQVPVIVIGGEKLAGKYANVVQSVAKPLQQDELFTVIQSALSKARPQPHPASALPLRQREKLTFQAHTGFFSLKSAIQMAYGDEMTGTLRVFLNRYSVELYFLKGRFLFATTRDAALYLKESPVVLSSTPVGVIVEAQVNQSLTGQPAFLYLAGKGLPPNVDSAQATRDHGQRVFANLWAAGRVYFEFEQLTDAELPEYARGFSPSADDPENWVLASLRSVKFDSLAAQQRPDPNGSPSYTRKGYEIIQKLKLNDVEARFSQLIDGNESLQSIAKKLGLALHDALLIVFRFQVLEIIDYWTLPGGEA